MMPSSPPPPIPNYTPWSPCGSKNKPPQWVDCSFYSPAYKARCMLERDHAGDHLISISPGVAKFIPAEAGGLKTCGCTNGFVCRQCSDSQND